MGANQPPPFENVDLFASDVALREAVARGGADPKPLHAFGADYGSAETMELGRLANENPPRLRIVEPDGERADRVEFHPAWHALMQKSMAAGLHDSTANIVERAAKLYMATQIEAGHICPLTMTNAASAALKAAPEILAAWRPYITERDYDGAFRPWFQKKSATLGMGMTERQSGTDVRAALTEAKPSNGHYEITGHKWFFSAPMSDGFLVLAQAPGGLSCFLMPRFRPDGSVNALRLQRLKDKLGNRSNASAEVEFFGAYAERVGAEGEGVRTILNMVQLTRLDCAIAATGQMRFGLALAVHHARFRVAFGRPLIEQPLMRAVLADLALESEANTALVFRLARAYAAPQDAAYARLMTPAVKYHVTKMAPAFIYETLECLGGNGYVEDFPMARLYREAPLNAIWEGSGNVMALDVLRVVRRDKERAMAVIDALAGACGAAGKAAADEIRRFAPGEDAEARARIIAEKLARLGALAALSEVNAVLAEAYAARAAGGAWGARDLGAAERVVLDRFKQCG